MLVEEQSASIGATLREGHDFDTQQQLALLRPTPHAAYHVQPLAARLTAAVLRELWMFERTGQLPDNVPWSRQPAWRVELWEAFWQAQAAMTDWLPIDYPLSGDDYE